MKSKPLINQFGEIHWKTSDGNFHRDEDKPSVMSATGSVVYCKNNAIHRLYDEPAIIRPSGYIAYYLFGKLHRDGDKPAEIHKDGSVAYFHHGLRHRVANKPAVIKADGTKEYWFYGSLYKKINDYFMDPNEIKAHSRSVWRYFLEECHWSTKPIKSKFITDKQINV